MPENKFLTTFVEWWRALRDEVVALKIKQK